MRAQFAKVMWSYRQNYFPYMSGQGVAGATISGVNMEMSFKLVRQSLIVDDAGINDGSNAKKPAMKQTLVPRLVLEKNSLEMANIELNEKGSTIGWVYNMLLGLFADVVKRYVIQSVTEA